MLEEFMSEDAELFLGVKSPSESDDSPTTASPPLSSPKPSTPFERILGVVIIGIVGAIILAVDAYWVSPKAGFGILLLGLVALLLGLSMARKKDRP